MGQTDNFTSHKVNNQWSSFEEGATYDLLQNLEILHFLANLATDPNSKT